MGAKESKIIRSIADSIKRADDRKTYPYDTQATIRRIEGNTAWVHIPGGVDETPVQLTINASEGDTVQVRVSGGRAFLVGNATAPPTDNAYAKQVNQTLTQEIRTTNTVVKTVQKVVQTVKKIADNTNQYFWHTETGTDTGAHITEIPQEEFLADPENGGGNLLARSNGIAVRDGLDELATFSADGAEFHNDGKTVKVTTGTGSYSGVPSVYATDRVMLQSAPGSGNTTADSSVVAHPAKVMATSERFVDTENPGYSGYNVECGLYVPWIGTDYYVALKGQVYDNGGASLYFDTNVDLDFIVTQSFDLGVISISAGTPGTASPQNGSSVITTNITKSGYTPIAVSPRYVSASVIGLNSFFNADKSAVITQVIRRQSTAASPGYHAYIDVVYIKS